MDYDITRVKAEELVNACIGLGMTARLHWDRSPWCCHIALVDVKADEFNEDTPGIFFMLEDADSYHIKGRGANAGAVIGWRWHSQIHLDRNATEQGQLNDINIEVIERTWLGDDAYAVAQKIALLLTLFKDPADLPPRGSESY